MDRTARLSSLAILIAAGVWAAARPASSGDLWVALGCGGYELSHGIGRVDPFSFTSAPGQWINQNWLSHVLFTIVHRVAGLTGLGLWRLAVCVAISLLSASSARALGAGAALAAAAGIAMAFAGRPFYDVRPNLHTILLAAILVRWIAGGGLDSAWRKRLPVVGLLVLWANLHGGFLFGVMALLVAAAARLTVSTLRRASRPGVSTLAFPLLALGATLISPYGVRNLTHPYEVSAGAAAAHWRNVTEWRPPFGPGALEDPGVRVFWCLVVLAAAVTILALPRRRRPPVPNPVPPLAAVAAMALLLAATSRRFVPLLAVAAIPVLVFLARPLFTPRSAPRLAWPVAAVAVCAAAALDFSQRLIAANALWPSSTSWAERLVRLEEQPRDAVDFLLASGATGRLLNDWAWGGYLIARVPFDAAGPRYRIFIDGRAQAAYPASISEEWVALQGAAAARDRAAVGRFLDAHAIEMALLDRRGAGLANLVPDLHGWTAVYGDDQAVVVIRDDRLTPLREGIYPSAAVREASAALRLRTGKDESLGPEEILEAFQHAVASVLERPTTLGVSEMARLALLAPDPIGGVLRGRAASEIDRLLAQADPNERTREETVIEANAAQARAVLAKVRGEIPLEAEMRERARALAARAERQARLVLR